jgi:hypothetical protein
MFYCDHALRLFASGGAINFCVTNWYTSSVCFAANGFAGFGGNTSPGYAVDVTGDINCSGVYRKGGTAGVTVGPYTSISSITTTGGIITALSGSSDARLKNAKPYDGGLREVKRIVPVRYKWNQKGQEHTGLDGEREYIGFTAQNVNEVIPEAITAKEKSKDGQEEYLCLDEKPIIAALVNAVKDLAEELKKQAKIIAKLQKKKVKKSSRCKKSG